jgi:hypothetical protein
VKVVTDPAHYDELPRRDDDMSTAMKSPHDLRWFDRNSAEPLHAS